MKITAELFEAHLKCPTKCWLLAAGEAPTGNIYAVWVKSQEESYGANETAQLAGKWPNGEVENSPNREALKSAKWRLALNVVAQTPERSADSLVRESPPNEEARGLSGPRSGPELESRVHAIERIPSEGRGKAAQFVPIRFIHRNKFTKDDKLLLAFDAFVLSEMLGREVSLAKIIHGDDHATLKVKLGARPVGSARTRNNSKGLMGEVRKRIEQIAALLSGETNNRSADSHVRESLQSEETGGLRGPRSVPAPPDLVLNRHCAECEFQARCRKIAVEKDDLSLLAGMSAKERQKLRSKGIFSVTQLSYTFRPRRRPKRLRDKREKYHHSLKALAIREQKIHIVGSPELKLESTPVYLDVEGLPDRDFYYLIGLRVGHGDSAVQHSLWANTVADEARIWCEFLAILETVEKPVLIHYGSYETTFIKRMCERYGEPTDDSVAAKAIQTAVNLLSVTFAQVYFPTYSNGLKEIARLLDFKRSEGEVSGALAVMWRYDWEQTQKAATKARLVSYNAEDIIATETLCRELAGLFSSDVSPSRPQRASTTPVVDADLLTPTKVSKLREFKGAIPDFDFINKAARWDYQRERVFVRSGVAVKYRNRRKQTKNNLPSVNKAMVCPKNQECPCCGTKGTWARVATRVLFDLAFGRVNVKRWVLSFDYTVFWCRQCHRTFGAPKNIWYEGKYGWNLVAFIVYQVVDLRIPQRVVAQSINRLWSIRLHESQLGNLKSRAASEYRKTRDLILERICHGPLLHADETPFRTKLHAGYVWVFASLRDVVYFYSETREGEILHKLQRDFRGVLVTDFYAAYDSMECPQQKCLIHLMRDLNDEVIDHPYDDELKGMVASFGELLRLVVETVDRHGLKRHFLQKRRKNVDRFYRQIGRTDWQSEAALRCKQRFDKNRWKPFTFLQYDDVPWNNNNAEHAIKAFAKLRRVIVGLSSANGIEEYLVLLSVCQTCKYMGVDFLDFLRSGEKDIHAFAESRRRRKRRSPTS